MPITALSKTSKPACGASCTAPARDDGPVGAPATVRTRRPPSASRAASRPWPVAIGVAGSSPASIRCQGAARPAAVWAAAGSSRHNTPLRATAQSVPSASTCSCAIGSGARSDTAGATGRAPGAACNAVLPQVAIASAASTRMRVRRCCAAGCRPAALPDADRSSLTPCPAAPRAAARARASARIPLRRWGARPPCGRSHAWWRRR